jgi:hypothetical protein
MSPSCKTTAALQGPSTTVLITGEDHLFLSPLPFLIHLHVVQYHHRWGRWVVGTPDLGVEGANRSECQGASVTMSFDRLHNLPTARISLRHRGYRDSKH